MAEPRTLPYITPSAKSPSSDIRTRTNVRAHVSINDVANPESCGESLSAGLKVRPYVPARTASPMVTIRMISKAAISSLERALGAGDLEENAPGRERRKRRGD